MMNQRLTKLPLALGLSASLWLGLVPAFAPALAQVPPQYPPQAPAAGQPVETTAQAAQNIAATSPQTTIQTPAQMPAQANQAVPASQPVQQAPATQAVPPVQTEPQQTYPQTQTPESVPPVQDTSTAVDTAQAAAPASPAANTPSALPPSNAPGSVYRSQWAQNSVQVLQENGIQLPQGINYSALIDQDAYIRLLAQVSSVPDAQLKSLSLPITADQPAGLTRGQAIHLVLASFGLTESLPGFASQPSKFSDLAQSHPAYASIVLAESVHLINGYPDHTIRPNEQLSWGEALILVETVYSWRKALPISAPEWVRNYQKRQNMWYQLIDGFRLLLTLTYIGLALYFFGRTWLKLRKQKKSPIRNYSMALSLVTLLLGVLWISELLFNYSLLPRELYSILAMISVFAGVFLLKLGADMDGDLSKPKPQVVIDAGYVTSINHEKGELFIRDKVSDNHSLALAGSDTKILRKTGKKSVESAFLSDIQIGDVVSLRASRLEHDSLIQIERLTLVEKAEQQVENTQQQQQAIREYVQAPQQQQQQQVNRVVPRRSA